MDIYKISRLEIHRELSGTAASHNKLLYFQRMIEKTRGTLDPWNVLDLYSTYWNTLLKNMKLYSGAASLFKELRKSGMRIAIVTSLTAHIQLRKIDRLGITDDIDVLVTSEEAGREKPHSSIFLLALNKLGMSPEDVVVVGDDPVQDMEGANAVGIDAIMMIRGKKARMPKEDYRKPDFVVKGFGEILGLIKKA